MVPALTSVPGPVCTLLSSSKMMFSSESSSANLYLSAVGLSTGMVSSSSRSLASSSRSNVLEGGGEGGGRDGGREGGGGGREGRREGGGEW